LVPLAGLTWSGLEPLEGEIGFTIIPAAISIGLKHYLTLQTWAADGTYANASARTVRRSRELIYLTVITCFAVWSLAIAEPLPAQVTAFTVIVCVPKFLFDCRDCGIGPWPLTFDPTSNNTEDELSLPENEPRRVFRNEWRVIRRWAINWGLSYAVVLAFYFGGILGMVGAIAYESAVIAFLGAGIAVFVSPLVTLPTTAVIFWLGYANEEYRVHDDTIVAYDTLLMEPQWAVSLENVESVSVGDDSLGSELLGIMSTLPFTKYPVQIKQRQGRNLQLETLVDPQGLVREIQDRKRGL